MSNQLLPQNQTVLEAAIANATQSGVSPDAIARLWDAGTCPVNLLPWLAWALSVDDWDGSWDEETQRRVIATSIDIHRKKGTVGAVKQALANFEHETKLTEWWQKDPQGTPHTFQIDVEIGNTGIDPATTAAIRRQIDAAKPVRSHYELRLIGRAQLNAYTALRCFYGQIMEVYPYQITGLTSPDVNGYSAISVTFTQTMTVYPL
ncbi:MAG: phage tail protein I [Betaproteobacteria bacterium]|nr:phage tail protein I [Betaproteobacteria bacterium]